MVPGADPGRTVEGVTMADVMAVAEAADAGGAAGAAEEAADRGGSQNPALITETPYCAGAMAARLGSISPMRFICAPTPRSFSSIRS